VLVHNNAWPTEGEARTAWPSAPKVREQYWWNIWRTRQKPFDILADGMPVLLLDAWPGGGVLSWLVRARDVHTERLADKNTAVRAIARWAGQSRAWVLTNRYSADRRADSGVVIYWRATPVARLGIPRPPQVAVRRNGWLVTDDATLASWGVPLPPAGDAGTSGATGRRRQVRRLDVQTKLAIEKRAITVASAWCRKQGWSGVKNVSANHSWDLEVMDRVGAIRFIEVKGTTGGPESVEVTKAEVDWASRHGDTHSLVIVHDILVSADGGKPAASGGVVMAYDPWAPQESELLAQRFTWQPSPSRTAAAWP